MENRTTLVSVCIIAFLIGGYYTSIKRNSVLMKQVKQQQTTIDSIKVKCVNKTFVRVDDRT